MKGWMKISTNTREFIKDKDGDYILCDHEIKDLTAHLGYVFIPVKISKIYPRRGKKNA
jgi:hypothetical protein